MEPSGRRFCGSSTGASTGARGARGATAANPAVHEVKHKADAIYSPATSRGRLTAATTATATATATAIASSSAARFEVSLLSFLSQHPGCSLHADHHTALPSMTPLTNSSSLLQGFVCPCDSFQGWKAIKVGGRTASRSFGDLRTFTKGFVWDVSTSSLESGNENARSKYDAGMSPLERLPIEVLGSIIEHLVIEIPPNGFGPRNMDLISLLLTSHALHSATLAILYKTITIPHSRVFRKFLAHISEHPSLGTIVRRLDFSHFNPTGAGLTAGERAETMNLTPDTLLQCVSLLPNLREFLAQEHIDEEFSAATIRTLLSNQQMKALDFCACSSISFRDAWLDVVRSTSVFDLPDMLSITRLSFHECTNLPASIYEMLLPRLQHLTHLDVAHTRITNSALASIPETARLTHLSLCKCSSLIGYKVVNFLTHHPAVKDTLIYLNLMSDARSHEILSAADITALLPHLPTTLRSLNLKGNPMNDPPHMELLEPLLPHLEELSVGRGLTYDNIAKLLLHSGHQFSFDTLVFKAEQGRYSVKKLVPLKLKHLDISDIEKADFDLMSIFSQRDSILREISWPLEVIEVSENMQDLFEARKGLCQSRGWRIKEAGRRSWLVRDKDLVNLPTQSFGPTQHKKVLQKLKVDEMKNDKDDGTRPWKMGALSWGMRKIPVVNQDVSGMYGLYMFKR